MQNLLSKKIPFYFFLIATGFLGLIVYHLDDTKEQTKLEIQQSSVHAVEAGLGQVRLNDYEMVKPLVMTEVLMESEDLKGLKRALYFEINQMKDNGIVNDASVYVRRLSDGQWISVNNASHYTPGSVIKIAAMITYLKMCEADPGLFTKEYLFRGKIRGTPNQTFNGEALIAGKKYSAQELLKRIIVHSDNNATFIINESLDIALFKKLFTDLGIAEPDVADPNFQMDVTDLSKFIGILYSASYLNQEYSKFALSLLANSSFSQGIVNGLPANVGVAHKFGEAGNPKEAQLHETAIVYRNDEPYLITIMTRGKNVQRLPKALSDLSKIAYANMKKAS
jgi:beta-lactamase class A